MPRSPVILVAAIVLSGLACAPAPEQPAPAGIALRFIADESSEVTASDLLYASQPVFHWSFASPDETVRWRMRSVSSAPGPAGRLVLEANGPDADLERSVQLDADAVDRIELRLAGQPSGVVELSWAGPLQRFSAERTIAAEPGEAGDDGGRTCSFDLHGHPSWTGRIARLRIDPFSDRRTRVALVSVEGSRQVADAARRKRPDLKVLFITGYAENAVVGNGQLAPGMTMVTKPFEIAALGHKVREVLDAERRESLRSA